MTAAEDFYHLIVLCDAESARSWWQFRWGKKSIKHFARPEFFEILKFNVSYVVFPAFDDSCDDRKLSAIFRRGNSKEKVNPMN